MRHSRNWSVLFVIAVVILLIFGSCKKESAQVENPVIVTPTTLTDVDGNVYPLVKIGNQLWMAENLKVTTTPSGTPINSFAPNNDNSNIAVYGRLYTRADAVAAAPAGWRLPTKTEFETLINFLGGSAIAGAKLKHTEFSPNPVNANAGTNESKFAARGTGYRVPSGGATNGIFAFRTYTGFWSEEIVTNVNSIVYTLGIDRANIVQESYGNTLGFSVRYIKE